MPVNRFFLQCQGFHLNCRSTVWSYSRQGSQWNQVFSQAALHQLQNQQNLIKSQTWYGAQVSSGFCLKHMLANFSKILTLAYSILYSICYEKQAHSCCLGCFKLYCLILSQKNFSLLYIHSSCSTTSEQCLKNVSLHRWLAGTGCFEMINSISFVCSVGLNESL